MKSLLTRPVSCWLYGWCWLIVLSACQPAADTLVVPTLANPDAVATGFVLTENAPPAGFDTVSFPRIDDQLTRLPGWRYEMTFRFDGVFARTSRTVTTRTQATVSYNQLGSARRVVARIDNDLESASDPVQLEGVRLGPDAFLVRDEVCLQNAGDDANLLADLSAGDVLGGVAQARPLAQIETINGERVWRYDVTPEHLILPTVTFTDESRLLELRHDFWVAPAHNAVVRFYITAEVENVQLTQSPLPVTGTLILRYDLYDIGDVPNINVPFGC